MDAAQRDPAALMQRLEQLRARPCAREIAALSACIWREHAHNLALLLSLAQLCWQRALYLPALRALRRACQVAPDEPSSFRWLGELLLRRGQARAAQRALSRALRLGSDDPQLPLWLQRSSALRALQARCGRRAVAREIARRWPLARTLARDAALPQLAAHAAQPAQWIATPLPTHSGWHPGAQLPALYARAPRTPESSRLNRPR